MRRSSKSLALCAQLAAHLLVATLPTTSAGSGSQALPSAPASSEKDVFFLNAPLASASSSHYDSSQAYAEHDSLADAKPSYEAVPTFRSTAAYAMPLDTTASFANELAAASYYSPALAHAYQNPMPKEFYFYDSPQYSPGAQYPSHGYAPFPKHNGYPGGHSYDSYIAKKLVKVGLVTGAALLAKKKFSDVPETLIKMLHRRVL